MTVRTICQKKTGYSQDPRDTAECREEFFRGFGKAPAPAHSPINGPFRIGNGA